MMRQRQRTSSASPTPRRHTQPQATPAPAPTKYIDQLPYAAWPDAKRGVPDPVAEAALEQRRIERAVFRAERAKRRAILTARRKAAVSATKVTTPVVSALPVKAAVPRAAPKKVAVPQKKTRTRKTPSPRHRRTRAHAKKAATTRRRQPRARAKAVAPRPRAKVAASRPQPQRTPRAVAPRPQTSKARSQYRRLRALFRRYPSIRRSRARWAFFDASRRAERKRRARRTARTPLSRVLVRHELALQRHLLQRRAARSVEARLQAALQHHKYVTPHHPWLKRWRWRGKWNRIRKKAKTQAIAARERDLEAALARQRHRLPRALTNLRERDQAARRRTLYPRWTRRRRQTTNFWTYSQPKAPANQVVPWESRFLRALRQIRLASRGHLLGVRKQNIHRSVYALNRWTRRPQRLRWHRRFAEVTARRPRVQLRRLKQGRHEVPALNQRLYPEVPLYDVQDTYQVYQIRRRNRFARTVPQRRARTPHRRWARAPWARRTLRLDARRATKKEFLDRLRYQILSKRHALRPRAAHLPASLLGGRPRGQAFRQKKEAEVLGIPANVRRTLLAFWKRHTGLAFHHRALRDPLQRRLMRREKKFDHTAFTSLYVLIQAYNRTRRLFRLHYWPTAYATQVQRVLTRHVGQQTRNPIVATDRRQRELRAVQVACRREIQHAAHPLRKQVTHASFPRQLQALDAQCVAELAGRAPRPDHIYAIRRRALERFARRRIIARKRPFHSAFAARGVLRRRHKGARRRHLKRHGVLTRSAEKLLHHTSEDTERLQILRDKQSRLMSKFLMFHAKLPLLRRMAYRSTRVPVRLAERYYFAVKARWYLRRHLWAAAYRDRGRRTADFKDYLRRSRFRKRLRKSAMNKRELLLRRIGHHLTQRGNKEHGHEFKFPKVKKKKVRRKVVLTRAQKFLKQLTKWHKREIFLQFNPRRYAPTYRKRILAQRLERYHVYTRRRRHTKRHHFRLQDRKQRGKALREIRGLRYLRRHTRRRWKRKEFDKQFRQKVRRLTRWSRVYTHKLRRLRRWSKLYKAFRRPKWWTTRQKFWRHKRLKRRLYKRRRRAPRIAARAAHLSFIDGVYSSYWVGRLIGRFTKKGRKRKASGHVYGSFLTLKYELQHQPQKLLLEMLNKIKPMFKLQNFVMRRTQIKAYPRLVTLVKRYLLVLTWLRFDRLRDYDPQASTESFVHRLASKVLELKGVELLRSRMWRQRDAYTRESVLTQRNARYIWRKKMRKLKGRR